MTPEEIVMVKQSWDRIVPIADKAAEIFYQRLFELDPELKPLFKNDMAKQRKMLMQVISKSVRSLDQLETLIPVLQELGRRHASYGVKEQHYDTVARALIWTLAKGLGDDFTEELQNAWIVTYAIIATTMKNAAREAAA